MAIDTDEPVDMNCEAKEGYGDETTDSNKELSQEKQPDGKSPIEEKVAWLEKRLAELEARYTQSQEEKTTEASKQGSAEAKTGNHNDNISSEKSKTDLEISSSPLVRVLTVASKIDQNGERKEIPSNQSQPESDHPNTKHAALLRKIIYPDNRFDGEIEIYDRDLQERLRTLLGHYPTHCFVGGTTLIETPYEALILNWDLLWAHIEKHEPDEKCAQTQKDLKELLETIKAGSGDPKLDSFLQTRASYQEQKNVTFETLWTIFPPGSIICGKTFLKENQIFIVADNIHPWPRPNRGRSGDPPNKWWLNCLFYDFDGSSFQRRSVMLEFPEFPEAVPIATLPFYPLDVLPSDQQAEIKATLLERGRKFKAFCTTRKETQLYKYEGDAIAGKQGFRTGSRDNDLDSDDDIRRSGKGYAPTRKSSNNLHLKDSNVMVDFVSYYRYSGSQLGELPVYVDTFECICADCKKNNALKERFKWDYDGQSGEEQWEDLQLMLCPPRVLGYVLKEKQWAQLAVNGLSETPIKENKRSLKNIYLSGDDQGEETKSLLLGLVKNHGLGEAQKSNKSYEVQDFVPDKGKGLVILLYGAPGVGKTSTAQMIAEAAGKPLIRIGVADVGIKAKEVEDNLHIIFDLATSWKAILLIDEADVFLQDRSRGRMSPSAEGSGLVSVFLQVLEYYKGILLLTTNQIAQFDVAVQSRVHIALKYNNLDKEQTKSIFMRFVNQFRGKGLVDERNYENIMEYAKDELCKKKFDGRQLRNIVSSAMGYARGTDSNKMTLKHIKHVVSYVEDFQKDLAGQMLQWQQQQKSASLN